MKIEEIKERFKDEWVLVEITKTDGLNQPLEGEVIAHSKNKDETNRAMIQNKEKYTHHFYTGKIPEGYVVMF